MGGLLIDTDSACVGANDKPIKGLYAAGEVRLIGLGLFTLFIYFWSTPDPGFESQMKV